jgi:hypothetical protein
MNIIRKEIHHGYYTAALPRMGAIQESEGI